MSSQTDPTAFNNHGYIVETLRLEVHPSVVFKLGADLVTDDVQALIELVKNAYDADATRVKVVVDTQVWTDLITGDEVEAPAELSVAERDESRRAPEGATYAPRDRVRGKITISDNGSGMDLEAIRRGWLTVSLSHKRLMKAEGRTTDKDRTPLGDKGLGRLGAQRLGDLITLTTRHRHQGTVAEFGDQTAPMALRVKIRWSDFANVDELSAIPIPVERVSDPLIKGGTTLEICGLKDLEFWRQGATEMLQKDLTTLISPYDGVSGFTLSLKIDDEIINLREKAQAIVSAAPVTYKLDYDGLKFHVLGRFTIDFLRPSQGSEEIAIFDELIGRDNGFGFTEWYFDSKQKRTQSYGIRPGDDRHFIISSSEIALDDLPDVERQGDEAANPGPFAGEISGVPLGRDATSVFDKNAEYRDFVRALVGVKVYRDGFGVRVDDDWLGLGKKWTSGSSYYNLRPGNVIGYINISAKENAVLEETTNREAFRTTGAYRNFYQLLSFWADYTEQVQTSLRRGYNDYKKAMLSEISRSEPAASPQQLLRHATSQIDATKNLANRTSAVKSALREIKSATERLEVEKNQSESALLLDPGLVHAVGRMTAQVGGSLQAADILLRNLDDLVDEQERLRASLVLLSDQIEVAQVQISDAWESVALGLSAEALAHEVHHISDGLRGRSSQISQYLKGVGSTDQRIWTFVEHVRSSASALIKQTSRLTPSLRFVRERKVDLRMSMFTSGLQSYYSERWANNGLSINLNVINDFDLHINEGKLTQVFDNLILNSEYWLLRSLRSGALQEGMISIEVDFPFVTIEDNGRGIDPSIEAVLFEPFVTLKPSQNGRGLGLFVVRQILDAEQASIMLTPERNHGGNRYQFRLNFSMIAGALGNRKVDGRKFGGMV